MRWFLVVSLTFYLCQLCPQCETLVSIMPPISIVHKKKIPFSHDLSSVLIRFHMGFNIRTSQTWFLGSISKIKFKIAPNPKKIGPDEPQKGPKRHAAKLWSIFLKISMCKMILRSRKWVPILNLIKTEFKSCENGVFFLWMIEIGGIIETNVSHWGHNWHKWNVRDLFVYKEGPFCK